MYLHLFDLLFKGTSLALIERLGIYPNISVCYVSSGIMMLRRAEKATVERIFIIWSFFRHRCVTVFLLCPMSRNKMECFTCPFQAHKIETRLLNGIM